MAKITKVKSAYLERLNNAEYRTFMARYGNLLAGGGGDSESPDEISFDPNDPLGIPQEVRTAFAADFALLTDAVNQSSASEETAQMSTLDKERDDLLIFITSTITQMTKSPLAAQRTAAEKLYLPVKPYIGAARLANLQETAAIEGLLVDLDKDGMPEALAALTLTEVVASLKEKNQQYAALTEQRTNAQAFSCLLRSAGILLLADYVRTLCEEAGADTLAWCAGLAGRCLVLAAVWPLLEQIFQTIWGLAG